MKKIIALMFFMASGMALAANSSYLFVQDAADAKLIHKTKNEYNLVMKTPSKTVWYFTDRPERKSGSLSLKVFDKLWTNTKMAHNFSEVPPNAAIALSNSNGKKAGMVAILGKPVHKDGTITYPLTKISRNTIHSGDFSQVILFIDNIQWNPGGF